MKPRRPYWMILAALSFADYASAYCRTTTCASKDCTFDEHGCEISGTKIAWASSRVQVNLQRDLTSKLNKEQTKAALTHAFQQWSNVICKNGQPASIQINVGDDVSTGAVEYNPSQGNVNTVFFEDREWTSRGIENGNLSKAVVSFDKKTGAIWDVDIAFNTATVEFNFGETDQAFDLETTALHEIGHFLGIAHSDAADSVMYPTIVPGERRRTLSQDDMDAICEAYPPGRVASTSDVPGGGFDDRAAPDQGEGCTSAGSTPSSALTLIGVALGSALLRRSQRRKTSQ